LGLWKRTLEKVVMTTALPLCRHCQAPLTEVFCDLGVTPLANSYLSPAQLGAPEPAYPLKPYFCSECLLVQLEQFAAPAEIFSSDYAYFSSYSDSWVDHARSYVAQMVERYSIDPSWHVVEIASNDGYLLQFFHKKGIPVLGIEPAANVAESARAKGITTDVSFFNSTTAQEIAASGRQADLLIGNNVLAHVHELNDFVRGLKIALKPRGIITIEVPHLLNLMLEGQFDTIYHEHYSYFSMHAIDAIFSRFGLRVFDVERLPTHGGSLRIHATHTTNDQRPTAVSVAAVIALEREAGLSRIEGYRGFNSQVEQVKRDLLTFLESARNQGKTVAGYGAPAKGNTLLNACKVRSDLLSFTVDRSPQKQGRFLPGVHIPIRDPGDIRTSKPDYLLILPWNLKDEIMQQMAFIRDWGGQFVVPIPQLRVLP
jgi:SAM-dependent methyltransferase